MSVHSATGYDLCPIGLTCCEVMKGKLQVKHTFIVCKNLQKELVIGFDMQQLYQLGCNITDNSLMFLHQGASIINTSISIVTNLTPLKMTSNVKVLLILLQLYQLKGLVSVLLIQHVYLRWELMK